MINLFVGFKRAKPKCGTQDSDDPADIDKASRDGLVKTTVRCDPALPGRGCLSFPVETARAC